MIENACMPNRFGKLFVAVYGKYVAAGSENKVYWASTDLRESHILVIRDSEFIKVEFHSFAARIDSI